MTRSRTFLKIRRRRRCDVLWRSRRMKQKVSLGVWRRRCGRGVGRPARQHTCLSLQALCPCCHLAALSESPYTQEHSIPPRWLSTALRWPGPSRPHPTPPPPTPTRSVLLTHLPHRRENAGQWEVYVRSVGARISQHPWAEPRGSPDSSPCSQSSAHNSWGSTEAGGAGTLVKIRVSKCSREWVSAPPPTPPPSHPPPQSLQGWDNTAEGAVAPPVTQGPASLGRPGAQCHLQQTKIRRLDSKEGDLPLMWSAASPGEPEPRPPTLSLGAMRVMSHSFLNRLYFALVLDSQKSLR